MVIGSQEDALVLAAKAGDSTAMLSLMAGNLPLIRRKARSAAEVSGIEAEDLVQEGLIGFLQAVRTFDPESEAAFSTYAYTCILNAIRSVLRSAQKASAVPKNALIPIEDARELSEPVSDPQEIVVGSDEASRMREMMDKQLSALEKEVLRLYLSGNSYSDIADVLSLSGSKAVDNALQRIRKKLKSFS